MADKTIGELTEASVLNDDSMLVVEQNGEARHIKGKVIKNYVAPYATDAQNASVAAQNAYQGVQKAIDNIPEGVSTPIVNDLTTGGTSMALSAEMGKVLAQRPNPNLLDNWYFLNPINRQGKSVYSGAAVNTIDRWKMTNAYTSLHLDDTGLIIIAAEGYTPYLAQAVDNKLLGKTVTLSVLSDGALYTATSTLPSALPSANTLYCNVADTCDVLATSTGLSVRLKAIQSDGRHFAAVKLELGSVQTLAHQDGTGAWVLNEIPDYAEQYAICCQYSPITDEFVGSQHSNPNLLVNWYFAAPINQRGQTVYSGAIYGIDRWRGGTSGTAYTIDADGLHLTAGNIRQIIETADTLVGKQLTYSILIEANTLSGNSTLRAYVNDSGVSVATIAAGATGCISGTFMVADGFSGVDIVLPSSVTGELVIVAVKLELGSVQTLARQDANGDWVLNDPPPNKQQELAKCQRYYLPLNNVVRYPVTRLASGEIDFLIPIPATMRTTPALVGTFTVYSGTTAQTGFTMSVSGVSANAISVRGTKSSHGLAGTALYLGVSGAALNAEL